MSRLLSVLEAYPRRSRSQSAVTDSRPYVKGLPITLTVQSQDANGDYSSKTTRPTYIDPYVLEMQEFYDAVVNGKAYKTTVEDAKNDIELANMIMNALVD